MTSEKVSIWWRWATLALSGVLLFLSVDLAVGAHKYNTRMAAFSARCDEVGDRVCGRDFDMAVFLWRCADWADPAQQKREWWWE